jgi:copper chaperone CopZ
VNSVYVDPGTGNVTVSYDPAKTSAEKLAQAIRDKGYSVDSVKILK